MTSDRPYRKRMSHGDAFTERTRCAGKQFDPQMTAALVAHFCHQRAARLREASGCSPSPVSNIGRDRLPPRRRG